MAKNSLRSTLALQEFRRAGGFTKRDIKIDIDKPMRETRNQLKGDEMRKYAKKYDNSYNLDAKKRAEFIGNSGLFVTNRQDIAKSVKISKKGKNQKNRRIDASYDKYKADASAAEKVEVYKMWELYNRDNSDPIEFHKFEKNYRRTSFKEKADEKIKNKMKGA